MAKRVLIGKFPDGGYGLRVSKSDYDVTSNPVDNEQLVFNSDWADVLGIYQTGTLSVSAGGTDTATHNLGYIPFASAMLKVGTRDWENLQCANVASPFIVTFKQGGNAESTSGQTNLYDHYCSFNSNPQEVYTYDNDGRTEKVQFNVSRTGVSFYSTLAADLYYIIYCAKAFT